VRGSSRRIDILEKSHRRIDILEESHRPLFFPSSRNKLQLVGLAKQHHCRRRISCRDLLSCLPSCPLSCPLTYPVHCRVRRPYPLVPSLARSLAHSAARSAARSPMCLFSSRSPPSGAPSARIASFRNDRFCDSRPNANDSYYPEGSRRRSAARRGKQPCDCGRAHPHELANATRTKHQNPRKAHAGWEGKRSAATAGI